MKRTFKAMLGVTLLEIMLVLAIAGMIIVMSIRYYQSATASQQSNAAVELLISIVAAADGISQGTGSYSQVNNASIAPVLSAASSSGSGSTANLATPWGGAVTITPGAPSSGSNATVTTFTVKFASTPATVCPLINGKLASNPHFNTTNAVCNNVSGDTTYTYTMNV